MTNSKYFQFISQIYKNLLETDEKNPTNNLILTLAKRNRVHRKKKQFLNITYNSEIYLFVTYQTGRNPKFENHSVSYLENRDLHT